MPLTAAVLLHASPTQMGILTAMEIVPFALFSLPTGVWLDRVRKLPVYIVGEISISLAVATVPFAWWLGWLSIDWLYLVGFVIGAVNTTAGSAAQIVLTQIVPRERLVEAHAKNALASSTAEVTGPGRRGRADQADGRAARAAGRRAAAAGLGDDLRGVRVRETPSARNAPFWPAMREGLRFVRGHGLLMTMAICVGVWQMCNQAAMVVQILFATRSLGLSARGVGLSYVAWARARSPPARSAIVSGGAWDPARRWCSALLSRGAGWLLLAAAR